GDTLFQRAPSIDFVIGTKAIGRVSEAIESVFDDTGRKASVSERASTMPDDANRSAWGTLPNGRVSARRFEKYIDLGERDIDYDWSVAEGQRHSKYVAFVPIIEGCNKFCTYCIVPFSRGREKSRDADDIIAEIKELRDHGYREIHLIGQNVNSYRPQSAAGLEQYKGATSFSRLLRA